MTTAVRPAPATLVDRIRAEYLEMPGLRLTLDQACRLWGVHDARGRDALEALVECRFLRRTDDGAYMKR